MAFHLELFEDVAITCSSNQVSEVRNANFQQLTVSLRYFGKVWTFA